MVSHGLIQNCNSNNAIGIKFYSAPQGVKKDYLFLPLVILVTVIILILLIEYSEKVIKSIFFKEWK